MKLSKYIYANKEYILPHLFTPVMFVLSLMFIPISGGIVFIVWSPFYFLFFIRAGLKVSNDKIPNIERVVLLIFLPFIIFVVFVLIVSILVPIFFAQQSILFFR